MARRRLSPEEKSIGRNIDCTCRFTGKGPMTPGSTRSPWGWGSECACAVGKRGMAKTIVIDTVFIREDYSLGGSELEKKGLPWRHVELKKR